MIFRISEFTSGVLNLQFTIVRVIYCVKAMPYDYVDFPL